MSNRPTVDGEDGYRTLGLNIEKGTSWGEYVDGNEKAPQGLQVLGPHRDAELNNKGKNHPTRSSSAHEINGEILNILTMMSHDIRGPLNSVAVGLKLLKKEAYGSMAEGVSQEVDVLFAMVCGLLGSAEDFLARAFSVEGGLDISKEPLHVKEDIVDPLLQELSREIQQHNLRIENNLHATPSDSLLIRGDRFWMRVILRNLLTNALKYAFKGGRITISFQTIVPTSR